MTYGGGMAYFTRRYVQEMDAIMDVAAADVNGDGKDELSSTPGAGKTKTARATPMWTYSTPLPWNAPVS